MKYCSTLIFIINYFLIISFPALAQQDSKQSLDYINESLIVATMIGDLEQVNSLIKQGANVNAEFENAEKNSVITPRILFLSSFYNDSSDMMNPWTPLHSAIYSNNSEMVNSLIESGATINDKHIIFTVKLNHRDLLLNTLVPNLLKEIKNKKIQK